MADFDYMSPKDSDELRKLIMLSHNRHVAEKKRINALPLSQPIQNETVAPQVEDKGMPGWGSMPMNMGLLQLGAGLLAQSGWQDEDISPGQALGRAMPGAVNSYFSGVKSLQDAQLYKAKMKDILDARKRDKGLVEALPGTIDSFKGKISGITDQRLDALKTLIPHAPQKVAAALQNIASLASTEKVTRRFANADEIKAGIPEHSLVEEDNTTGELKIVHSPIPGFETKSVDGGTVILQGGKVVGTVGTSKSSDKSLLEKIDPAFPGLVHKDPLVRAAARWHLTRPKNEYVPELDSSGNETGRSILTSIPRELSPELEEQIAKSLQMDTEEVPIETPSETTRPTTKIKETDVGYNRLAKRLLPPGSSQGDIVAFADQLAEWNPDFPSTNLPLGQEIFTGPPQVVEQPKEESEPIAKKQKLSESQGKASSFARQFSQASEGLDKLFITGYRPNFKIWNNIMSRIEEKGNTLDKLIVHQVLPGTVLSEDDKKFASYVLTMGTRSIRDISGAALKGTELRDELDILFPIIRARGLKNSDKLEEHFRGKRLGILEGMIDKGGALPKVRENLRRYRSKNPFLVNTQKKDLIKEFNLTPPP